MALTCRWAERTNRVLLCAVQRPGFDDLSRPARATLVRRELALLTSFLLPWSSLARLHRSCSSPL
jgi:hypothetical protein